MPTDLDRSIRDAGRLLTSTLPTLGSIWKPLAASSLLCRALAFVVLLPLIGVLFRLLIARSGSPALADVDIALFFFTTVPGAAALLLISALVIAVTALEQVLLMTLGLARERGVRLRVRDAAAHGAARALATLRLTFNLVVRLLLLALPFAAIAGAVYALCLREHDINYYLTYRPPVFWVAVALAGVEVVLLAIVLVRLAAGWVLALPLVVYERVLPFRALGESRRRMAGRRTVAALALAAWCAAALLAPFLANLMLQALGRQIAPAFAGSTAAMLVFIGGLASIWLAVNVALGIAAAAWLALIVVRLYVETGGSAAVELPRPVADELTPGARRARIRWQAFAGGTILAVLAAGWVAHRLMQASWSDDPVLVIAHRGASADSPENTLAAFARAGEQHADFVELDVQETSDGVVVVAHDSDLMKVGRSPLRIWDSTAEQLRAVDIGTSFSPEFADQRVPTLAEALETCKGVTQVVIELKDYGHAERLEERVVELVEAAGMQDRIVTMSLSLPMVVKMKSLRPKWTAGLLAAKSIGDTSRLPVDFLAVESGMATRSFVRAAHGDGIPVYVWTVDDPNRMIRMIGQGVDGLITNRPALAREVVASIERMSRAERLFLLVMTRLGASAEISEPASDLRP